MRTNVGVAKVHKAVQQRHADDVGTGTTQDLRKAAFGAIRRNSYQQELNGSPRSPRSPEEGVGVVGTQPYLSRPSCSSEEDVCRKGSKRSAGSVASLEKLDEQIQNLITENPKDVRTQNLNIFMGGVLSLNAIVIALETDLKPDDDHASAEDKIVWVVLESLFCVIYIAEITLRVRWESVRWFRELPNMFDSILVLCMVVDVWILPLVADAVSGMDLLALLRLLRLARLLRLLRLIKVCRGFYAMAVAFVTAVRSMIWVCVMMTCGLFICAIFTTNMIGKSDTFRDVDMGGWSGEQRFGTVLRSMYSLFELMTLEGWVHVGRPLVSRQPAMFLFLFAFIMVFTFGLLNMIVAMVVDATIKQAKKLEEFSDKERKLGMAKELANIRNVFVLADANEDGEISLAELEAAFSNEQLQESLRYLGIPLKDAKELYNVLDADGSGSITIEEFVEGLSKLRGDEPTNWDIIATYAGVRTLVRQVTATTSSVFSNGISIPDSGTSVLMPRAQSEPINSNLAKTQDAPWSQILHKLEEQSAQQADIINRLQSVENEQTYLRGLLERQSGRSLESVAQDSRNLEQTLNIPRILSSP